MAKSSKNGEDRSRDIQNPETDLQTTDHSERPMAHSHQTHHLNGSNGLAATEVEEAQVILPFLKTFWPYIFSGCVAILSAAYATGYIQTPATKSSVEELAIEFRSFKINHDKIDSITIKNFATELADIKSLLSITSDRTRNIEIGLAELKGSLKHSPK